MLVSADIGDWFHFLRTLGLRTVRGNMRRDFLQGAAAASVRCPMFNVPRADHHARCWLSPRGRRLQTDDYFTVLGVAHFTAQKQCCIAA